MFTIIGTMFTGIILGYIFRNLDFLKKTEKTISYHLLYYHIAFVHNGTVRRLERQNNRKPRKFRMAGGNNSVLGYLRKHHRSMAGTDSVFQERRKP